MHDKFTEKLAKKLKSNFTQLQPLALEGKLQCSTDTLQEIDNTEDQEEMPYQLNNNEANARCSDQSSCGCIDDDASQANEDGRDAMAEHCIDVTYLEEDEFTSQCYEDDEISINDDIEASDGKHNGADENSIQQIFLPIAQRNICRKCKAQFESEQALDEHMVDVHNLQFQLVH